MVEGGDKPGLMARMKSHWLVITAGGLGTIALAVTGVLANLGTFLDTETGRSAASYLSGDQTEGPAQPVTDPGANRQSSQTEGAGTGSASTATPLQSFADISVTSDGTTFLARKASGLERRLSQSLGSQIDRAVTVEIAISGHSGSVAAQSLMATIVFSSGSGSTSCAVEFIEYGSDPELERILSKIVSDSYRKYQGRGSC